MILAMCGFWMMWKSGFFLSQCLRVYILYVGEDMHVKLESLFF